LRSTTAFSVKALTWCYRPVAILRGDHRIDDGFFG
jgi:hypothetical protein